MSRVLPELTNSQKRAIRRKARRIRRRSPDLQKRTQRKNERAERAATRVGAEVKDAGANKGRLSIDRLRYQFDQGARANRYTVDFYCPKLGLTLEGVRCVQASLPGRQIETGDFSEYGPTRKLPFNLGMDGQEVSFQFICDSTFADRFLIEAWQGAIFDGYNTGNSVNPQFRYYYDYVGEIVVHQITRSDKLSLEYRIHEAYPISFAPMELSSDATDLMRFETTFAFRTWESTYSNPPNVSGINRGRRFLDALSGIKGLGGSNSNDALTRFSDRLAELGGIIG